MRIYNKLVLAALILSLSISCSNQIQKSSSLSKAEIYLQSVNLQTIQAKNYGYNIGNPIVLKLSSEYQNENIIELYIKRLWQNGQDQSEGKLQSFNVIESRLQNNYLYTYKIISSDKRIEKILYFKLMKKTKEFYVPEGFGFGMLSG